MSLETIQFLYRSGVGGQVLLRASDRGPGAAAVGGGVARAQPVRDRPLRPPPLPLGRRRRKRAPRRRPGMRFNRKVLA